MSRSAEPPAILPNVNEAPARVLGVGATVAQRPIGIRKPSLKPSIGPLMPVPIPAVTCGMTL